MTCYLPSFTSVKNNNSEMLLVFHHLLLNTRRVQYRGRGVLRFGLSVGCAARASKPIPIFKVHFCWKRNPFLGIFLRKKANFSQFSGVRHEILEKWTPCLGTFLQEMGPIFWDFLWKSDPLEQHIPVCLNMWVPPRFNTKWRQKVYNVH